jgi:hypothetical protein
MKNYFARWIYQVFLIICYLIDLFINSVYKTKAM